MIRNKLAFLIVLALFALAILMSLAAIPAAIQESSSASISHVRAQFSDVTTPTPTASGSGASGGGNGGG